MTVIINGVKPGESVVTRGQLQLAPGMKVAAQEDKIIAIIHWRCSR